MDKDNSKESIHRTNHEQQAGSAASLVASRGPQIIGFVKLSDFTDVQKAHEVTQYPLNFLKSLYTRFLNNFPRGEINRRELKIILTDLSFGLRKSSPFSLELITALNLVLLKDRADDFVDYLFRRFKSDKDILRFDELMILLFSLFDNHLHDRLNLISLALSNDRNVVKISDIHFISRIVGKTRSIDFTEERFTTLGDSIKVDDVIDIFCLHRNAE
ncbi:hypothetical protein ACOME3_003217 [Neoechinorhynchus agilis]